MKPTTFVMQSSTASSFAHRYQAHPARASSLPSTLALPTIRLGTTCSRPGLLCRSISLPVDEFSSDAKLTIRTTQHPHSADAQALENALRVQSNGSIAVNGHHETGSETLNNGQYTHPELEELNGHEHRNGHHASNGSTLNGHHSLNDTSITSSSQPHSNGVYSNGHHENGHLNGHGTRHQNGAHEIASAPASLNGTYNGTGFKEQPIIVLNPPPAVTPIIADDDVLETQSSHSNGHGESIQGPGVVSTVPAAHVAALTASLHTANGAQHHQPPPPAESPSTQQQSNQQQQQKQQQEAQDTPDIPHAIMVISFVSASLTMASCVFNTLLPVYMVTELKMNMRSMGMFEGFLEAFSYAVRMFSGVVSDMMTSRKSAITLGFAMGAMAKFGMSGATTVTTLFASKAVDRLANGVQAAPRDALISDLAPASSRSACFGFAQSMRKWGSFIGAGLAYFLMKASGNNYQLIFLMAASVTVASTIAFVVFVPSHARPLSQQEEQEAAAREAYKEQKAQYDAAVQQQKDVPAVSGQTATPLVAPTPPAAKKKPGFDFAKFCKDAANMGSEFYRMLAVICLYGLGHVNESMLEARAIEVGFGKAESTLIVALLALTISISAWPLGKLDDKHGPRTTFALGMSSLIAGNLVLMMSGTHPWTVYASCMLLGVHWAVIQGPLLSVVVSLAPSNLRGTAFGIFYTVMALTTVIANTIYGNVWHTMGASSAFALSAGLMVIALVSLPHLLPKSLKNGKLNVAAAPSSSNLSTASLSSQEEDDASSRSSTNSTAKHTQHGTGGNTNGYGFAFQANTNGTGPQKQ